MGEHAAGVPGWEGSYERRGAVESDAVPAGGLRPGELAGVPFDEGFDFRRDVEVLVEAGIRLADLGVSELDEQPIALTARAAGEVEADDDASIRQASQAITLDGVWRPGEDFGDRDTAWTREFFAALGRFREGVYVNFLGGDEDPDRVREAYGDSVYDRLVDVKTTYDPDNVFHHNQNIRPGLSDGVGGSDGEGRYW